MRHNRSENCKAVHMAKNARDVNDFPFQKDEMKDHPNTMGKPLDTADAPGRADSEMAEDNPLEERRKP
jgi:hypothetical protein